MTYNAWREVLLEDVAAELTVGFVGSMTSEYVDSGIPFLRSKNVEPYVIKWDDMRFISREFHEKLRKSALAPGDVVIVRTGKPGAAALIPTSLSEANCSDVVIVRPGSQLDARFLVYYLNSLAVPHINAHLVGAVQQHFNVASARKLRMKLPSLDEQKAIAHILGTLDDKIELNQQMNGTLEAIAQAIFKSWFVDFDPVRAKMDGRQPEGMDVRTADLFPDSFEDSPLGKIPKGWNTVPFEDLFLIPQRSGLTKPKQTRGLGTYMVNMRELFAYRRIGDLEMERVPLTQSEAEKNLLQTGDLLFARRSLTWEGAGQCSIIIEAKEPRTFEGSLIRCRLNPEKAVSWCYFYYFLSDEGRGRIESVIEQVAVAGIRSSDLAKLIVLAPSIKIQRCFGVLVEPLEKKMASNDTESRTLANIRDALLPKLLSGEIRLKEAEKLVEAVA